jgi:glutamate N-acetyltransferase/amino-acid N-acetyltransferase
MSTNDTVLVLASGRAGVAIRPRSAGARTFSRMLRAVAGRLAGLNVQDGEGASRVMAVHVVGARSAPQAQACARQVASSLLVKTMLAGGDPNVGRIAAAVGASGAAVDPDALEVWIGTQRVIARGVVQSLRDSVTRTLLRPAAVTVRINLHAGTSEGRMLTCDLTEDYVRLNARYST